jgi:hypothetical protein
MQQQHPQQMLLRFILPQTLQRTAPLRQVLPLGGEKRDQQIPILIHRIATLHAPKQYQSASSKRNKTS